MSLRNKVVVLALAVLVAVGGLSFALTSVKHASILDGFSGVGFLTAA